MRIKDLRFCRIDVELTKNNGQIHFNRKFDLCPMVFGGSHIGITGCRKSWNQRILAIFLFGIIICPRHIHVDFEDHFDSFANFRQKKKNNFYSFTHFVLAFLLFSHTYCIMGLLSQRLKIATCTERSRPGRFETSPYGHGNGHPRVCKTLFL